MIKWILENKEWLFSGIGVTILFGVIYFIRRAARRSQSSTQPGIAPNLQSPAPRSLRVEPRKLVELDVHKIMESISSLPPFQRDDARKHYIGVRFRFTGALFSAEAEEEDRIRISLSSLNESHLPLIFGSVPAKDNSQLRIVHEGTKITIEGDLAIFDSYTASLNNIEILSHEENEQEGAPNKPSRGDIQ